MRVVESLRVVTHFPPERTFELALRAVFQTCNQNKSPRTGLWGLLGFQLVESGHGLAESDLMRFQRLDDAFHVALANLLLCWRLGVISELLVARIALLSCGKQSIA